MPGGNWNNNQVNFNENNPENENHNARWRSAVKVYVLCVALSQPPSIRPISASFACVWKTLVSLTSFNSKYNRNFKEQHSNLLPAFIKKLAFISLGAFFAMIRFSMQSKMEFSVLIPSENFSFLFIVLFKSNMIL